MGIGGWLRRLLGNSSHLGNPVSEVAPPAYATPSGEPVTVEPPAGATGPVWCVVANVLNERLCGPGKVEVRRGTKHFAPGAKVYVFDFYWGTGGEKVTVVGRHRKSGRYITLIMPAAYLANWRAELVYSPHVIEKVLTGEFAWLPRGGPESQARAEEIVTLYIKRGAVSQPFTTRPPHVE